MVSLALDDDQANVTVSVGGGHNRQSGHRSVSGGAHPQRGGKPSGDGTKPEVKEDTGAQQFLFIFGGSGEPGLVGELQDASPM